MNDDKKKKTGLVILGIVIGALFGWAILYAMIALFGVTIYGATLALVSLLPVMLAVWLVYALVKHFINRREYRKWKRDHDR